MVQGIGYDFLSSLARGKKAWRVPVRGPVVTNDRELLHSLALSGHGLLYTLEGVVADHLAGGRLQMVLERYAPIVPGLFLYFPSRAQESPALRALIALARADAENAKRHPRSR